MQVARPLTEVDQSLHRFGLLLFLVSAGGIGLATLLGAMIARTAIGPVENEIDTLIVDAGLDASQREMLEHAGVRLIVAGEPEEFQ